MNQPTIAQYLMSTCLLIIDEFNEYYSHTSSVVELKRIADTNFSEMDITSRIGYPFRSMAHFVSGNPKDKIECAPKSNHDIVIESKQFNIEVKFAKNWKCKSGTFSGSATWDNYQKDFNWLLREVQTRKNQSAFIIGWFNVVPSLGSLIQLGSSAGSKPMASDEKLRFFPFLNGEGNSKQSNNLIYRYDNAYEPFSINIFGYRTILNCIFLGQQTDRFHFAIYY
jgi:hypothetical protein